MIPQDCPEDRAASEGASSESAGPVSAFPLATGWEGLHRLAVTLAGQRDAALIDWRKWKDDPLMQDVAEHYAEKWAALGYVIACIDSRLRLAPPNSGDEPRAARVAE